MPHSTILGQDYTVEGGEVTFADGVKYSPVEMASLRDLAPDALKQVHELKRAFGGRVLPRQER